MKTKYFEYNRNGGSEKYSEFTEAEYLKAKEDENRWFISFGDSVLECEESQYSDHFSKKDHGEYTQKDRNWKKVIPVSLEQYTYGGMKLSITLDTFPTRIMKRSVRRQPLRRIFAALQQGEAHQWTSRSCGCSSNS